MLDGLFKRLKKYEKQEIKLPHYELTLLGN